MSRFEGISKFVGYKNAVERERPLLTANPKLVAIDGIDGSGKSTIARAVVRRLNEKFGQDAAMLVSPSKFNESKGQEKLFGLIKNHALTERNIHKGVVASFNRAYNDVILPALERGKIVVVDRSEVDLLRYGIENRDEELLEQRKKYISEGTVTHRLWAGNRIFIEAPSDDVRRNLHSRSQPLSDHDIAGLRDVEKRKEAEREAEEIAMAVPHDGDVRVIRKENRRTEDARELDSHISRLADEIVEELVFGDTH